MIETSILRLDKPTVSGDADAWGGMLNTNADDLDIFIAKPRWKKKTVTSAATTVIDLADGNFFEFTVGQSTTLSITNVPATLPDTTVPYQEIVLKITNGGSPFVITWPGSIVWPFETANAAPTGLASAGVDIIVLKTYNAGTTWYAELAHVKTDPNLWPRVSVYKSAAQSLSGGLTTIAFDVERFDVGNMHDNVTNNSRLTIPSGQGGLYHITIDLNLLSGIAGRLVLRKNGSTDLRTPESIDDQQHHLAVYEVLNAGEYIEARFQNDGALNQAESGILKTSFSATRIR